MSQNEDNFDKPPRTFWKNAQKSEYQRGHKDNWRGDGWPAPFSNAPGILIVQISDNNPNQVPQNARPHARRVSGNGVRFNRIADVNLNEGLI